MACVLAHLAEGVLFGYFLYDQKVTKRKSTAGQIITFKNRLNFLPFVLK
jgi:hypothetical protein